MLVGFFHLAEDFGLAEHHGVEPGGDAGEVAASILALAMVEGVGRSGAIKAEALLEKGAYGIESDRFRFSGVFSGQFGRGGVDLNAITGGKDDSFGEAVFAELEECIGELGLTKSDPLAECDGCGLVIEAETDERQKSEV